MKLLLRIFLIFIFVFVILWLIDAIANQGKPLPPGSESAKRLVPGSYKVEHFAMDFVDESRGTQANKDFEGKPTRTLKSTVWVPKNSGQKHPLIIYSHGFSSNKDNSRDLQEYLTSHGYIVIAPNYPLTNTFAPGGPLLFDIKNQPGDISFLIDQALMMSASENSLLSGLVDPTKIGVAGISLGGLTSTVAAYHPDKFDPRIGAAVSIAGPTSVFTQQFFEKNPLPFLMIAGGGDRLVSYQENAVPVPEIVAGSQLITLELGSHVGFADGISYLRWFGNPDRIGCHAVLQNMDEQTDPRWKTLFGAEVPGIEYGKRTIPCQEPSPKKVMNSIRQTKIMRLAVRSFFDSIFLDDVFERARARDFLSNTLSKELSDVSYERHSG